MSIEGIVQELQRATDAWAFAYAHRHLPEGGYGADAGTVYVRFVARDMSDLLSTGVRGPALAAFVAAANKVAGLVPQWEMPTEGSVEAAPARMSALRAALEAYYIANPALRPDQYPED